MSQAKAKAITAKGKAGKPAGGKAKAPKDPNAPPKPKVVMPKKNSNVNHPDYRVHASHAAAIFRNNNCWQDAAVIAEASFPAGHKVNVSIRKMLEAIKEMRKQMIQVASIYHENAASLYNVTDVKIAEGDNVATYLSDLVSMHNGPTGVRRIKVDRGIKANKRRQQKPGDWASVDEAKTMQTLREETATLQKSLVTYVASCAQGSAERPGLFDLNKKLLHSRLEKTLNDWNTQIEKAVLVVDKKAEDDARAAKKQKADEKNAAKKAAAALAGPAISATHTHTLPAIAAH